jgi:hypothetical protein
MNMQEKKRLTKEDVKELKEWAAEIEVMVFEVIEAVSEFIDFIMGFDPKDPIVAPILDRLLYEDKPLGKLDVVVECFTRIRRRLKEVMRR